CLPPLLLTPRESDFSAAAGAAAEWCGVESPGHPASAAEGGHLDLGDRLAAEANHRRPDRLSREACRRPPALQRLDLESPHRPLIALGHRLALPIGRVPLADRRAAPY